MKNLAAFDNSYPALSETVLSNEQLDLIVGGNCPNGCKKQCTTQKKTQTVHIKCVLISRWGAGRPSKQAELIESPMIDATPRRIN